MNYDNTEINEEVVNRCICGSIIVSNDILCIECLKDKFRLEK